MRRLVILFLLLAGLQLILPLGASGAASQWLLTLGFLMLAAYSVGEIASGLGLPKVVGYLAGGIAFGPAGMNAVTAGAITALEPVSTLAIALIAFLAGAELRWSDVRTLGSTILKILTVELALTLVAVTALLMGLGSRLPFLAGLGTGQQLAFSFLFACLAVIHSPAVTMAVLSETGARGPIARTSLGIVLVADVVVVLLFTAGLAIARAVVPAGSGGGGASILWVAWELGGAVLVGAALGGVVALYLRFFRQELFLFAVLVAFAGAVIARLLHVEPLLMLITAGFLSENVSMPAHGDALRDAMERSADPVFVVFFALAGAAMDISAIVAVWPVLVPIILVRALALWGGTVVGASWAGVPEQGRFIWTGLVAQAGVAIGLAAVVTQAYPARGPVIQTIFLATLGINQLLGPILFRRALSQSGEIRPSLGGRIFSDQVMSEVVSLAMTA